MNYFRRCKRKVLRQQRRQECFARWQRHKFWNSILDILKRKAAAGVEVKVLYDDIGCMMTLPGNYHKILKEYGIEATPFSRLRGNADSELVT